MGIPMGVPYFQIKDTLKSVDAQVFSSHFTLYRDISSRVFATLKDITVEMEQYSIDEAFFALEAPDGDVALEQIRIIKAEVERLVGIPVSVGVSYTKTQAKYASRVAKKSGGTAVLLERDWQSLASEIGIGDIWGVGSRLVARYKDADINTVADLRVADTARLRHLFGVGGVRLQAELLGRITNPLSLAAAQQKSIMNSRSFAKPTHDVAVVKDALAYHTRLGAAELRAQGILAGIVQVLVLPSRHGDFAYQGFSREVVLPQPTSDTTVLLQAILPVVEALFDTEIPYQKAGVVLRDFVPKAYEQATLFTPVVAGATAGQSELMRIMDNLNTRWGKSLVEVGRFRSTSDWQAKREALSPAYTTRWSDVPKVKAV